MSKRWRPKRKAVAVKSAWGQGVSRTVTPATPEERAAIIKRLGKAPPKKSGSY